MISVSLPVTVGDKSGFILSLNVDAVVFRGVLNSQGLSEDWVAEIMDRSGAIIARSREYEKWIGKLSLVRSMQIRNEETPFETIDSNGKAVVAASATSPMSGWKDN